MRTTLCVRITLCVSINANNYTVQFLLILQEANTLLALAWRGNTNVYKIVRVRIIKNAGSISLITNVVLSTSKEPQRLRLRTVNLESSETLALSQNFSRLG